MESDVKSQPGSRLQLAIDVADLHEAIDFYTRLFATPPAKVREGYANFEIVDPPLKLVLLESPATAGSLNHLGIEVADPAAVAAATQRLGGEGLGLRADDGVCCFADQAKVWVDAPDDVRWEVYAVVADSPTFFADPQGGPTTDCCAG